VKKNASHEFLRVLSLSAVLAVTFGDVGMLHVGHRHENGESRLSTSPALPSVEGTAKFSVTANDNTAIELTVKHLPRPERLSPPQQLCRLGARHQGRARSGVGHGPSTRTSTAKSSRNRASTASISHHRRGFGPSPQPSGRPCSG